MKCGRFLGELNGSVTSGISDYILGKNSKSPILVESANFSIKRISPVAPNISNTQASYSATNHLHILSIRKNRREELSFSLAQYMITNRLFMDAFTLSIAF